MLAGFDRFSLVAKGFSATKGESDLGDATIIEINTGGYEGEAFLLHFGFQFADFAGVQKKLAFADGFVLESGAEAIGADVELHEPHFIIYNSSVGLFKRRLFFAQTLHFRADQKDAAFELFEDFEAEGGLAVSADGLFREGRF